MFTHNTKYRDVVILNNVKDLAKLLQSSRKRANANSFAILSECSRTK